MMFAETTVTKNLKQNIKLDSTIKFIKKWKSGALLSMIPP